jgi:trk system potassium uptake protein
VATYRHPVAVIGLGRFGSALALELSRRGTEVLAVDSSPALTQRLAGQLSQVVAADATDLDAMRDIGVQDFTRAVVAIGTDRQASILATSVLADLEVDEIWAKALDRQHARILDRVGAHHVVLPEHDMGERVAHLVGGRLLDWIELGEGWVIATTKPPRELVGIPLGESGLRTRHGVTVVSVKPERGGGFRHTGTETRLAYGDLIVIAGRADDVERYVERQ